MSSEETTFRKFGEGHVSAMGRLGLGELRGALYPESNVAQHSEYGLYGTLTPGEVAEARRGESCHSFYTGWPRFLGPKATISEMSMKRCWEPGILCLLGFAVRDWNAPLGTYLIFGAASLAISVGASEAVERQRALDMNDAVIDQEQTAERFRVMRGERWQ